MRRVAAVALVDPQGRLLLQERDEHAPVDPEKWSLVGGGIEQGESDVEAALRELEEETGLSGVGLDPLGVLTFYCDGCRETHEFALFTAFTDLTDADVECHEGRQIVFVDPTTIDTLDWNRALAVALPQVVGNPSYAERFGVRERHEFGCVLLVDAEGGVLLQERDERRSDRPGPLGPRRWPPRAGRGRRTGRLPGARGGDRRPARAGNARAPRDPPGLPPALRLGRPGARLRSAGRPHRRRHPSATRVVRSCSCRLPAPVTSTSP